MSFYANPAVTVYAQWHCGNCGAREVFDPDEDGTRFTSDHRCPGYYEEDDEWC